jgi:glycosyltransferase involved in cell wall biosynthesis
MKVPALYFCDFPPLNLGGGGLLMEYLLRNYPSDRLTILTGSHYFKLASQKSRPATQENYVVFPVSSATGRWGAGRLRLLLDWLALPFAVLLAMYLIKRRGLRVILSVAHGRFFVAAAVVARLSGVPLVLWVHDDWVTIWHRSWLGRYFSSWVFSFAVQSARHVYAVSTPMADRLRAAYRVEAEVQLPCSEAVAPGECGKATSGDIFRIAFAGTNHGTGDTVGILASALAEKATLPDGRRIRLHLYLPPAGVRPAWRHENIVAHPWLSQPELRRELCQADLLFLPYNFSQDVNLWTRSFPTKAADYLRYGKPIVVMAPAAAAIVPYARTHGFAEVIDRPDKDALLAAIRRIASDAPYCAALSARAVETFQTNHDAARQRRAVYQLINRLGKPLIGHPRTMGSQERPDLYDEEDTEAVDSSASAARVR